MAEIELKLETDAKSTAISVFKNREPVATDLQFEDGVESVELESGTYEIRVAITNPTPAQATLTFENRDDIDPLVVKIREGRLSAEKGRGFDV